MNNPIVRWRHKGTHMVKDPTGPWILVGVLEHYKKRVRHQIEGLQRELIELREIIAAANFNATQAVGEANAFTQEATARAERAEAEVNRLKLQSQQSKDAESELAAFKRRLLDRGPEAIRNIEWVRGKRSSGSTPSTKSRTRAIEVAIAAAEAEPCPTCGKPQ